MDRYNSSGSLFKHFPINIFCLTLSILCLYFKPPKGVKTSVFDVTFLIFQSEIPIRNMVFVNWHSNAQNYFIWSRPLFFSIDFEQFLFIHGYVNILFGLPERVRINCRHEIFFSQIEVDIYICTMLWTKWLDFHYKVWTS